MYVFITCASNLVFLNIKVQFAKYEHKMIINKITSDTYD